GDCTIAVADECVHVVRTYAQRRLLRKASDALIWIRTLGIGMAWHRALEDFIRRRMSRRHMPNSMKRLKQMLASTCGTAIVDDAGHPALWQACSQGNAEQALYEYASILRAAPWGRGTTIEYIVNVLLPLGYALMLNSSKPCQAQYVLDWYWTLPAAQRYAELQRQFPLIEQQYVWQQQGLLEYMRVCTVPYARSTLHAVAAHSSADMVITLFDRV
ncbi:MAG: hypothetical protein NZ661_05085, partial [Candidatus Kapabacteria bacterium]|nr:hypothetical protein [Candidatus Kapabacteria bacterium]